MVTHQKGYFIVKSRERLLNAMRGKKTDHLPWSPNLGYWWQYEDAAFLEQGEVAVLRSFGCDPLIRGHKPGKKPSDWEHVRVYSTHYGACSVDTVVNGNTKTTFIRTPLGELRGEYRYSSSGYTWFLQRHPVQSEKDYETLITLFNSIELEFDNSAYIEFEQQYGEDALLVPILPIELNLKSGFQSLLEFWVGTEQLAYDVYDFPDIIEETLKSMRRVSRLAAEICAASDAEAFLSWEDTSTTNISPSFYEQYILPELNEWSDILHQRDKLYMQHACGHLKNLVSQIGNSRVDGIESITPPPVGNLDLQDARKRMKSGQFLIGGIDAVRFLNSSQDTLRRYVLDLIEKMDGTPFVLANSDACPPGVAHGKFRMISELVRSC